MNLLFFKFNSTILAEGEGFEPSDTFLPHAGFQDRYLQPLGHPSVLSLNFGGGGGIRTPATDLSILTI